MLDYVIIQGEKEFPINGILNLNDRSISHFNEIENLEDLSNLRELHLQHNKIKTLEGLKNLKKLKVLQLNDNEITVLSNLESLENLELLDLSNNNIIKIENDLELKNLKKLDLYQNELKIIASLEYFVNLEEINLSNNHIEKISGLSSLKRLKKLVLSSNDITRIEGLENLESLELLFLGKNNIEVLEEFNNLKNLKILDLRENKINRLKGLENLSNLYRIKLSGNKIPLPIIQQFGESGKDYVSYCRGEFIVFENKYTCIDVTKAYENIKNVLVISGANIHKITDLKNLENLRDLEGLNLGDNEISDIKGLDSLENLKLLWLSSNNIKKIKNLGNLKKLENLSLSFNKITQIEGLETLTHLKKLNLRKNFIKNIENLDKLTELSTLSLQENEIKEITGLNSLLELKELTLSNNRIQNTKGIEKLRSLEGLILQDNFLTDIDEISNLTNLTILNLGKNQLNNISSIESLINLTKLKLGDNNIEDIEDLSNLKQLRKLGLENNNIHNILSLKDLIDLKYINLKGNPVHIELGHILDLSNNNPRRYIAYAILEPILKRLSGEIFWDKIIEKHPFLKDFHLNEIKEIIKLFPEIQLLVENGKTKSFSTFKNLVKALDTFIEPFEEQEDIKYSLISEKLCLPREEDAKKICKIIIEKELSRFPLYDIIDGIRKKVRPKTQDDSLSAFKQALLDKRHIYIEPMGKEGGEAEIYYVFSQDTRDLRIAKLFKQPIGIINRDIILSEGQKLIDIKHENIVEFYDKGVFTHEDKEYLFYIEEYIDGKNLREIDSRILTRPFEIRLKLLLQILKAESEFLEEFETHNDLSLDNIMITKSIKIKNKKIKIIDPGSSKYVPYTEDNDYDLLRIQEELIEFFLKEGELDHIGGLSELKKLSLNDLKDSLEKRLLEVEEDGSQENLTEDQKIIVSKLEKLWKRIHSNHPFEDIKVRYMDSNFYKYLDTEHWDLAKNSDSFKSLVLFSIICSNSSFNFFN